MLSLVSFKIMGAFVVVDTNVFVSALLSPSGENREVIRICLAREAVPLMGSTLFNEYEDLLSRRDLMDKSPLPRSQRKALFSAFLSVCEWVKVFYSWRPNLPDEADNHLVELAVAGQAQAIITNNLKDVARGELSFPGLRILTPKSFLDEQPWPP